MKYENEKYLNDLELTTLTLMLCMGVFLFFPFQFMAALMTGLSVRGFLITKACHITGMNVLKGRSDNSHLHYRWAANFFSVISLYAAGILLITEVLK